MTMGAARELVRKVNQMLQTLGIGEIGSEVLIIRTDRWKERLRGSVGVDGLLAVRVGRVRTTLLILIFPQSSGYYNELNPTSTMHLNRINRSQQFQQQSSFITVRVLDTRFPRGNSAGTRCWLSRLRIYPGHIPRKIGQRERNIPAGNCRSTRNQVCPTYAPLCAPDKFSGSRPGLPANSH